MQGQFMKNKNKTYSKSTCNITNNIMPCAQKRVNNNMSCAKRYQLC